MVVYYLHLAANNMKPMLDFRVCFFHLDKFVFFSQYFCAFCVFSGGCSVYDVVIIINNVLI